MLLLKFFVNCEKHSTHSEYQRSDKLSSLQEVKNNGKSLNRQPQIVVTVALSGRSFKRGLIIRLWLGKFWCFGKKVAYERCSHLEVRLYSLLFLSFHESRSWCPCRFRKINRLTLSFRALSLWSQDIKRFFFQGKNMSNTPCPKTGRCLLSKQTHHSVNFLVCSGYICNCPWIIDPIRHPSPVFSNRERCFYDHQQTRQKVLDQGWPQ